MRRLVTKISICSAFVLGVAGVAQAQQDTTAEFKPHGTLWGYTFGDFDYKGNADNLNRGGSNQYTGMPATANAFQYRRIYLGYNYDISQKFSAEFLLAAEDDFNTGTITEGTGGTSAGDVTAGGKFTPYVKYGNIAWKNIYKNAILKVGQQATPSFAKTAMNSQTAEEVWGYRCVERTVSDIRRTTSFDMGASLQGWFDNKGNYGYMAMVGNGQSAKPDVSIDKFFYGDVYAKFFDKRLLVDLYGDYSRLPNSALTTTGNTFNTWGAYVISPGKTGEPNGADYESRSMRKLFVAWNTEKLTVGFEGFQNTFLGGLKCTGYDGYTYYRNFTATDLSFYVRGRIKSAPNGDPRWNFFVRYDNYNPSNGLSNAMNNYKSVSIASGISNYDPFTMESFFTAGIDYMPVKNVHIIPNIWMNTYTSSLSSTGDGLYNVPYTKIASSNSSEVTGNKGTDVVWRLTFYYIYNPKQGTTKY